MDVIAISCFNPHWGHGEAFNAANWRHYPHNEIYLEPPPGSKMGRRLDSYSRSSSGPS